MSTIMKIISPNIGEIKLKSKYIENMCMNYCPEDGAVQNFSFRLTNVTAKKMSFLAKIVSGIVEIHSMGKQQKIIFPNVDFRVNVSPNLYSPPSIFIACELHPADVTIDGKRYEKIRYFIPIKNEEVE